jgi:hypothetical protein
MFPRAEPDRLAVFIQRSGIRNDGFEDFQRPQPLFFRSSFADGFPSESEPEKARSGVITAVKGHKYGSGAGDHFDAKRAFRSNLGINVAHLGILHLRGSDSDRLTTAIVRIKNPRALFLGLSFSGFSAAKVSPP